MEILLLSLLTILALSAASGSWSEPYQKYQQQKSNKIEIKWYQPEKPEEDRDDWKQEAGIWKPEFTHAQQRQTRAQSDIWRQRQDQEESDPFRFYKTAKSNYVRTYKRSGQMDRQMDKQMDKQMDRQMGRQMDIQMTMTPPSLQFASKASELPRALPQPDTDLVFQDARGSIIDVAIQIGLTYVVRMLELAGLRDVLEGKGSYTLIAANNQFWEALPQKTKFKLLNDKQYLRKVLSYHIVPFEVNIGNFRNNLEVPTLLEGKNLRFNLQNLDVNTTTFSGETSTHGYLSFPANNGIIHIADGIMTPPEGDIVDLLENNPAFSIYRNIVKITGRDIPGDHLRQPGPLTTFAPINSAFRDVPKSLFDNKDVLIDLVRFGSLRGNVYSAALQEDQDVQTILAGLQMIGKDLNIRKNSSNIDITLTTSVGQMATVLFADCTATNGVLHAVDTVLLPPFVTIDGRRQRLVRD